MCSLGDKEGRERSMIHATFSILALPTDLDILKHCFKKDQIDVKQKHVKYQAHN